jgi:hypothetical protein
MSARRERSRVPDPAGPGQRRRGCVWIEEHLSGRWFNRCPRANRTGQECWCRPTTQADHDDWLWRVVPPLVPEGHPGPSFDYFPGQARSDRKRD